MCGITGFFLKDATSVAPSLIEKMTASLAHRGPDGQGLWSDPSRRVQLGHRRLSIIDVSELGNQPMRSHDGRYTLTFNGEIYNYVELRAGMGDVRFRSQSDTEVLLELYARRGPAGLAQLNGMYAFAVYDEAERELVVVRDPVGVKPLYYFSDHRGFFFASEIRALLTAMVGKPALRRDLLLRYLKCNWMPGPETLLEGIRKLEPGHYLRVRDDLSVREESFYDWNFKPEESVTSDAWVAELDATLDAAVDRQLRSDVPVGFFLSGGLDSSLLLAKGVKRNPRATAFTVGFRWTETPEARLDLESARYLHGSLPFDHRELILEPSIVGLLPTVARALEEPLADPAAVCSYLICEAAGKEFKVLISGQGGDELFGGYPTYRSAWIAGGLRGVPRFTREGRLGKFLNAASTRWPEPFFILRSAMPGDEADELILPELRPRQQAPFGRHYEHYERATSFDRFHQAMYLDIKTYLVATNLTYSDKTSMAHSVELRVPFLDLEIARLVQRMPSRFKVSLSGGGKLILKKLARRYLPERLIYRKKTGFGLPLRQWMREALQPMARDLLGADRLRQQNLFDPAVPSRWLDEHKNGVADHGMRLYSLMIFQLWLESLENPS